MANNLFPEGYKTEVIEFPTLAGDTIIGYKPGIAFANEAGDFVRDGKYRLIDNSGIESLKNWIINCLHTQRYAHLAYDTDFGIDIESVFKAESRAEAESILAREITEALLADKYSRIEYLSDMSFEWTAADAVVVSFVVHAINAVTIDITTSIAA